MNDEMQRFLFDNQVWKPGREIKIFIETVPMEKDLSVSIMHRVEKVGSTTSTAVRPVVLRPLFQHIEREDVPFIENIIDGIRFSEMLSGFVVNKLDSEEKRTIGEALLHIVKKHNKFYLAVESLGDHREAVYLNKYECKVASAILSRVFNQCEFP